MNTFSGMENVSQVEQNTSATMVVVEGEEMQSAASDIISKIQGDLESVKVKLQTLSTNSVDCWKEAAGDKFRAGVTDMMSKLDNVVTELSDAANTYQQMGAAAVDLEADNAKMIESSL